MNPRIKKQWVEALRSGNYKQGREYLRRKTDTTQHCCLGVLCDIYFKSNGFEWDLPDDEDLLPNPVMRWAGLGCINPIVEVEKRVDCIPVVASEYLTVLNDKGMPFKDIADFIEEQL